MVGFTSSRGKLVRGSQKNRRKRYKYSMDDLKAMFKVTGETLRRWEKEKLMERGNVESVCRRYGEYVLNVKLTDAQTSEESAS